MRYMLLLHHPEELRHAPGSPEFMTGVAQFDAFHAELADKGITWEGAPLQPSQATTSVRVRDGELLVTDGPFAELHEQLGGYYVFDLPDLDAAIEIASKVPWAAEGTVEIRPLVPLDTPELVSPTA